MNRTPQSKRFWRILGPILIYWGIQFLAQIIVQTMIMITHMQEVLGVMESLNSETYMDLVAQLSVTLTKIMLQYQSQISAFIALCTIPLAAFLFSRDRKMEKDGQLLVNKKAPWVQYIWVLIFGIVFCLGGNVLLAMSGLAMKDTSYITASAAIYSESMAVLLLCQGIVVPIAEELMFRGVLFKRCREQMSFWGAAFSVSCFFAFVHGTVTQLMYTLILGIFLAYVYEKLGSLKAPVLLHILVNVVSIVATKTGVLVWLCSSVMRMAVCIIGCAFIGAIAFVKIQKIDEKPEIHVD